MKINGVIIEDTFAEAFPMRATRLIITAINHEWAMHAALAITGFATSVIACGCEAGIEASLKPAETPDGRPGVSVLFFGMSKKDLIKIVPVRVGQCVMTCASAACYSGMAAGEDTVPLGKSLRYFGDGYQIAKVVNGKRYWRIPVMHGEFICEESSGISKAIGGGNFIIIGKSAEQVLRACEKAIQAIKTVAGVITPFPGGVVGSGSKVGSKYKFLPASTNQAYCPTLKGQVKSELSAEAGSVLEIVIDGLNEECIRASMQAGIEAVCSFGPAKGIYRISAGNYGGNLGPYHFHLKDILS